MKTLTRLFTLLCAAAAALGLAVALTACTGGGTTTTPADTKPGSDSSVTTPITPDPGKTGSLTVKEADGTVFASFTGSVGSAVKAPAPKTGYRTALYFEDAALTKATTLPTALAEGDRTLYVRFADPITYTLTLDPGEGLGQARSFTLTYDERFTLPANTFTYSGKQFAFWQADGEGAGAFVDGARVKNLTDKDGATVTLRAVYETADSVNFTVKDGVVLAYTGTATTVCFPVNAHTISADVFKDNAAAGRITKIIVPDSYTRIEQGAFAPCKGLTALTLPFIGETRTENRFLAFLFGADSYKDNTYSFKATYNALYGLQQSDEDFSRQVVPTTLKTVTLTEEVNTIGEGAFYMVYGLQKLIIPHADGLYAVGNSAFEGCWQLGYDDYTDIQNPLYWLEQVETIGERAFMAYGSAENDEGRSYTFTRIFEIPKLQNIRTVGKNAFYGCVYLMKLEFGPALTEIGEYAFTSCATLKSVVIPDSVTDIGNYAFTSCQSLTEVTLGKSVRRLGSFAFADCTSLGKVTVAAASPAKVALIPFSNGVEYKYNAKGDLEGYTATFTHLSITVPSGTADAYRTAWTECAPYLTAPETAEESTVYFGKRDDGSFDARLRFSGNLIYVTDPYGELRNLLDLFDTGSSLGTEYVLYFRLLPGADCNALDGERFYEVSNPAILDYDGSELKTTLRVRESVYEKDGKTSSILLAETLGYETTYGKGENSLYRITLDAFGHATLYVRSSTAAEFAPVPMPAGAVYAEVYNYVNLAYDEQYLAVVYQDIHGAPVEHRYFFTLGDTLVKASYQEQDSAITFLSYGDIQITLDGSGTGKISLFEQYTPVGYVGAYTQVGKYGDAAMTLTFTNLTGENGKVISGTATLDGFFDGRYHRCQVALTCDGAVLYRDTVYPSGGLEKEQEFQNKDDKTSYTFYEYRSQDGETAFFYAILADENGRKYHGTYAIQGTDITLEVEHYTTRKGKITDKRGSFTLSGAEAGMHYLAYGYYEEAVYYMEEDFYGVTLEYYTLHMDGYGNATLHDTHDDDIDIRYRGTYYNTYRTMGEDDYGPLYIFCFTGQECDDRGNVIEGGQTATYYYVVSQEQYENEETGAWEGTILTVSQSAGTTEYDVLDERGARFATMEVDPFGITTLTLLTLSYDKDGNPVYTEDAQRSALLSCVAYLDNSGAVAFVVVSDKAGNLLFTLAPDDSGTWRYVEEHAFVAEDGGANVILP